jgi:hypothetical protein
LPYTVWYLAYKVGVGQVCWNDLSTEWPNGHLGPWSRALIGGAQP